MDPSRGSGVAAIRGSRGPKIRLAWPMVALMTSHRPNAPVLGVFGGAFDPPHLGHAMVPDYLRLRGLADRVLVVPCADHPLGKDLSPFARRMALTRAAMAPLGDAVQVSDVEARLFASHGGPSYTLRMLEAVAAEHPHMVVRLVVGTDILSQVERWHRWEDIERRFAPIVVPRTGYADAPDCALPQVNSTEVRQWLRDGGEHANAKLEHAVPAAVLHALRDADTEPGPQVWVVGHGHVGSHAVPWLRAAGCTVTVVGGRALVDGTAALPETAPDAVWVLVRDPALPAVAEALAASPLPTTVPVLHAAGAVPSRVGLAPLATRGYPVGTLHPICSLRRERPWPSPLPRAAFGLEGDAPARAQARRWLGEQPWLDLRRLGPRQRRAYHAACSLAANHLAVPYAAARDVMRGQGQPPAAVESALHTLLSSALDNLLHLGVPAGVTGPVARGDQVAVQAHLDALDPDAAALYRVLSERLTAVMQQDSGHRDP